MLWLPQSVKNKLPDGFPTKYLLIFCQLPNKRWKDFNKQHPFAELTSSALNMYVNRSEGQWHRKTTDSDCWSTSWWQQTLTQKKKTFHACHFENVPSITSLWIRRMVWRLRDNDNFFTPFSFFFFKTTAQGKCFVTLLLLLCSTTTPSMRMWKITILVPAAGSVPFAIKLTNAATVVSGSKVVLWREFEKWSSTISPTMVQKSKRTIKREINIDIAHTHTTTTKNTTSIQEFSFKSHCDFFLCGSSTTRSTLSLNTNGWIEHRQSHA